MEGSLYDFNVTKLDGEKVNIKRLDQFGELMLIESRNYRTPPYSNMGCYSRNESVHLFLKYEMIKLLQICIVTLCAVKYIVIQRK